MNAPLPTVTADRSQFLGGSDAAAVMGLSPYATPVELWQEKTGRTRKDPEDPIRQRILARGQRLEPFIREMTIEKLRDMGLSVELLAVNQRYVDPEHAFLSCEIDFELELTGIATIGGNKVDSLRAEAMQLQAETEAKLVEIRRKINTLLAIEHHPAGVEA